jgi:predicted dienelactone hydrolase
MTIGGYDPFSPGPWTVSTRATEATDAVRGRAFPVEVWFPEGAGSQGNRPLVAYSHHSGGHWRSATFLCQHLASHGYVVAAITHSEIVAPELAPQPDEAPAERSARIDALIASRVPDLSFLLDVVLSGEVGAMAADPGRIGLAGHSLGGWTALATPESDPRVRSVVAMAPGGSSRPVPGVLALPLTFAWGREVPVLYLAAEDDVSTPLDGIRELFDRTPGHRQLVVLRRADHQHFSDDVEASHEALRNMTLPGPAAWIPAATKPISELCTGEQAHLFARGLALAHLDATLLGSADAERLLSGDLEAALTDRGVEAFVHRP